MAIKRSPVQRCTRMPVIHRVHVQLPPAPAGPVQQPPQLGELAPAGVLEELPFFWGEGRVLELLLFFSLLGLFSVKCVGTVFVHF